MFNHFLVAASPHAYRLHVVGCRWTIPVPATILLLDELYKIKTAHGGLLCGGRAANGDHLDRNENKY